MHFTLHTGFFLPVSLFSLTQTYDGKHYLRKRKKQKNDMVNIVSAEKKRKEIVTMIFEIKTRKERKREAKGGKRNGA